MIAMGAIAYQRIALLGKGMNFGFFRSSCLASGSREWRSELRSSFEKRIDPPKDTFVTHDTSHALHARSALGRAYLKCFQNRVGHFFHIVRIDEQGAGLELLRRAGELAQDEHAIAVDTARAIFLRHEIHSILERRDEGDVASAVVREKIFTIEAAKMILHRQPGAGREAAVDIANQPIDALLELVIPGNLHPARHDDLYQDHAAAQFRMTFQSGAKCAQALGNSLAVIEPIRTKDQLTTRKSDPQPLRSLLDRVGPRAFFKRGEVDPNRKMSDSNFAIFESNQL